MQMQAQAGLAQQPVAGVQYNVSPGQMAGGPKPMLSSGATQEDGDWPCPSCGNINFRRRDKCHRCALPRPAEFGVAQTGPSAEEGDWPCPECTNVNFRRREKCNRCGAPRPPQ